MRQSISSLIVRSACLALAALASQAVCFGSSTITLSFSGANPGTVTSDMGGLNCTWNGSASSGTCTSTSISNNDNVTLTASVTAISWTVPSGYTTNSGCSAYSTTCDVDVKVNQFGVTLGVSFDAATKLVYTTVPSTGTVGTAFSVTVASQDASGHAVSPTSSTTITLSVASGSGSLSGTLTGTIGTSATSVTISTPVYSAVGTMTLTAAATAGETTLTPVTSGNIVFSLAQGNYYISLASSPASPVVGQTVTFTATFTAACGTGPPLPHCGSAEVTLPSNYTTITYSSVTVSPAVSPVWAQGASSGQNLIVTGTQTTNNPSTITVVFTAKATTVGSGLSWSSTVHDGTALGGTAGTLVGSEPSTSIAAFGPASQLVFTTQPGGGTAATAWSTQPQVTLEDAEGNTVTGTSQNVTLTIQSNPGGGTLSGTNMVAVNTSTGVAAFSGLSIDKSGVNYTLTATGNTVDIAAGTVVSSNFTITAGTATQLVFTNPYFGGQAGVAFTANQNQPVVAVEDAEGNTVTSYSGGSHTVVLAINTGSGTITCTNTGGLTLVASSGVAAFTGCSINNAGTYTLKATTASPSLSVISTSLTIVAITAVTMKSFEVTPEASGNRIQFETGLEVNSLGFNVYRDEGGQRIKLNPSLLAGTAFLGAGTSFDSGYWHSWLDSSNNSRGFSYWVEEVDLNGARTWYGPVASFSPSGARTAARGSDMGFLRNVGQNAMALGAGGSSRVIRNAAVPMPPLLQQTLSATATPLLPLAPQSQAEQYTLAAGQAIRIGVPSPGWYVLTQPNLVAAGLSAGVNPNNLRLFLNGAEVPILVTGQAGGQFGTADAVEFYGQGLDTIWSGTQEYWLLADTQPGQRIGTQTMQGAAGASSGFSSTVEWQPRSLYFAADLNNNRGDGNNIFGPVLESGSPVSQVISLTNVGGAPAASPAVQVILQGAAAGAHQVSVQLNGNSLGTMTFDGLANYSQTLQVSNGVFVNGANTLTFTVLGGDTDVSVVDTVYLSYPHTYNADSNLLQFTAAGGSAVQVGGFSTSDIQVVDITNPLSPIYVTGTVAAQGSAYAVSLGVPVGGTGTRTLLAFTSATTSQAASIVANQPSTLHSPQAGADIVMIANSSFISSLGPLQSLRQSQGHTVSIVDVDDIYDEFNFGNKSPYAIKTFLSTALAQWNQVPKWVLLVGDATFDPRNFLGTGLVDYIPTKLIDTTLNETSSDDWFVDFNNDGVPVIAIGRFAVTTAAETTAQVNKVVAYEAASGGWKNKALLVAGGDDGSDNFTGYTAAIQSLLPATVTVSSISVSADANAANDLLSELNSGLGLVNYAGHGSESIWENSLLSSTQASALTNGSATPFVLIMTCLNGYFHDVYATALAKALMLAPGGGASAVWASSALTDSPTQSVMNQAMIGFLFGSPSLTIGEAAAQAKASVMEMDVRRTWILFGDPAMKLH